MTPAGQGLLPGVVDLVLLLAGPRTLLIEAKVPKTDDYRGGRLSTPQKHFRSAAIQLAHHYHLVETVEAYHALLATYAVPMRRIAFRH